MGILEDMQKAFLADRLKAKNLKSEEEWLEYHLGDFHFGVVDNIYDKYKNYPRFDLGVKFPDHIVCIKTNDCFFPKEFQQKPCFEIFILDTNKQQVIYYTLGIVQTDTVCPLSWRIADHDYAEYLSDTEIDIVILRHILETTNLCIDHHSMYGGNLWYWNGVIRELGVKHGYSVYSVIEPNRAIDHINFQRAKLMKPNDFCSSFIVKLTIDDYCFIIKK